MIVSFNRTTDRPAPSYRKNAMPNPTRAGLTTQQRGDERGSGLPVHSSQLELGRAAYVAALDATARCETFRERLDMYRIAAEAGNTESRVRYVQQACSSKESR